MAKPLTRERALQIHRARTKHGETHPQYDLAMTPEEIEAVDNWTPPSYYKVGMSFNNKVRICGGIALK